MEYLFQVFYPSKEEGRNIHIEHGAVNKYKLLIPKQRKQFAVGDNISCYIDSFPKTFALPRGSAVFNE